MKFLLLAIDLAVVITGAIYLAWASREGTRID